MTGVIGAILVFFLSCLPCIGRELERNAIQDLKVTEEGDTIRVSGRDMESAWPITKITYKKKGRDMIVSIRIALAGTRRGRGSFDEQIPVSNVDRVLVGKRKTVIWERSGEIGK